MLVNKLVLPLVALLSGFTNVTQSTLEAERFPSLEVANTRTGNTCTTGFVNFAIGRAYTAGHCGTNGDVMELIGYRGKFTSHGQDGTHDWGYASIPALSWLASAGPSWSQEPPKVGDRVCYQSRALGERCGIVLESTDSAFFTTTEGIGMPGDSGAAAYRDAQVAGLYTGISIGDGGDVRASFVRLPADERTDSKSRPHKLSSSLLSSS